MVFKSYLIQVINISIVEIGEKCGKLYLVCKKKDFTYSLDVSWCSEIPKTDFLMTWLVFPPAPKKGMVRFSKKGTFNPRRHAMRALLSARRHAKRVLKMNLFIYLQSKSLIVITVLFMLPADL